MKRSELRRALKQRAKELRGRLAQRRREARAQLAQDPRVRRRRARRRQRRLATVAALLLLAAFARCDCETPPPPSPEPEVVAVAEPPVVKPPPNAPPKPLSGKMKSQPRASYRGETRTGETWLDDFRLQVAARSPRLARCFTGTERPGALRWTTAVNATSGTVSDHQLDPVGSTAALGTEQHTCVVGVLSSPGYRLKVAEDRAQALPSQVSIVIEF